MSRTLVLVAEPRTEVMEEQEPGKKIVEAAPNGLVPLRLALKETHHDMIPHALLKE